MNFVHKKDSLKEGENMPKILKDIEEKILNSAMQLFIENGYEKVDMRKIAKENKIAVGTLYNYYSNKKELMTRAFEESWKGTLSKLDEIVESNNTPEEKINLYVVELYDGISGRKGLGKVLISNELLESSNKIEKNNKENDNATNKFKNISEKLVEKLEGIILEISNNANVNIDSGMEHRVATSYITLTWNMLIKYPNEKEKNIEFLKQFIQSTFSR